MEFDIQRVIKQSRNMKTEDLLDQVTVYKAGLEPEAIEVLEDELRRRGVTSEHVREYEEQQKGEVLWERPGVAYRCAYCERPARRIESHWYRWFGLVPLFKRPVRVCRGHSLAGERGA